MSGRSAVRKARRSRRSATVLVQVKISRQAVGLLRKRAARSLRTQASYLRNIIYRDLGLVDSDKQEAGPVNR